MEPRDLVKVWDAPDNSTLTPKQWSIRLPILVAAKINALCVIFPRKSKTEIIGDLLATALDQMEKGLHVTRGEPHSEHEDQTIYYGGGQRKLFLDMTAHFLRQLEEEANVAEPMQFNTTFLCDSDGNPCD